MVPILQMQTTWLAPGWHPGLSHKGLVLSDIVAAVLSQDLDVHDPITSDKAGLSFVRRAFLPRAIGLGTGFLCVAVVLWERQSPIWLWALLVAFSYGWPLLAYWLALRSRSPYVIERRQVLFDSLMGGFWIASIGFNVLPTVMMLSMLAMNNTAAGGVRFVLRGMVMQALGMVVSVLLLGFSFTPQISQQILYACLPMLVIHPLTIGLVLYRLAIQLGQHKRTLRELSRTDSHTGLFNRRYWSEQASLVFDDCRARGQAASLALIDVKSSNDRYGHIAGDEVLREVGRCIQRNLRLTDIAGRYGGDEFCVLLPDTESGEALTVLERLREEITSLAFSQADGLSVSLSIGIAGFHTGLEDAQAWLKRADEALYRAKELGRNRVVAAAG